MINLKGLNNKQQFIKRLFDISFSLFPLIFLFIPILILVLISTFSTGKFGLFTQQRVGKNARLFTMYKIRTMKGNQEGISIAALNNSRITSFGNYLRNYNLDEIPQLFNVLKGDMSIVGPRPDVVGFADALIGKDRLVLTVKPGITGPATIKYRNEDKILINQVNPIEYNENIIWKDKVRINKQYIENWTLLYDIQCIIKTIIK